MSYGHDPELARLLDEAVARLIPLRRTFTEEEALGLIWEAWGEVSPQCDPRFLLAHEAGRDYPRHWRLDTHVLANNRLLDALTKGEWDGRGLGAALSRLDAEEGGHHVFCPVDPRWTLREDGTWEPVDREPEVSLSPEAKAALDELGPLLLKWWRAAGASPRTLRQITETLGELGWTGATTRGAWLHVRTWLRGWSAVLRVGRDSWV